MTKRFAVSLLALAAGSFGHDALATDLKAAWGLKPEPDSVLAEMRGGFVTAGGLTFDIGITTSTYIDGQLALRTSIATGPTTPSAPTGPTSPTAPTSPTSSGAGLSSTGAAGPLSVTVSTGPAMTSVGAPPAVTVQTSTPASTGAGGSPPAAGPAITPVSTGGAGSPPVTGPTTTNAATPQVQGSLAPAGGATSQTVTATTPTGQTLIQNPSQLVNVVTNTANNQTISLNTQVNLVLPGFSAVQRSQLLSAMGVKMGVDGAFGIISALPH